VLLQSQFQAVNQLIKVSSKTVCVLYNRTCHRKNGAEVTVIWQVFLPVKMMHVFEDNYVLQIG